MREQIQNIHHACIIKGMPQLSVITLTDPITGKSIKKDTAPRENPAIKVVRAACLVPLRQNIPQRNTVVIGGAR